MSTYQYEPASPVVSLDPSGLKEADATNWLRDVQVGDTKPHWGTNGDSNAIRITVRDKGEIVGWLMGVRSRAAGHHRDDGAEWSAGRLDAAFKKKKDVNLYDPPHCCKQLRWTQYIDDTIYGKTFDGYENFGANVQKAEGKDVPLKSPFYYRNGDPPRFQHPAQPDYKDPAEYHTNNVDSDAGVLRFHDTPRTWKENRPRRFRAWLSLMCVDPREKFARELAAFAWGFDVTDDGAVELPGMLVATKGTLTKLPAGWKLGLGTRP
jgi:hypothetical protein